MTIAKLALFDIDGTLLSAGKAPRKAISRALKEIYDIEDDLVDLPPTAFAGKTDPEIVRAIFARYGGGWESSTDRLPAFFSLYTEFLKHELPSEPRARLMPGVRELLEELRSSGRAVLGLLTGNIEEGAFAKLDHFGLTPYFTTGSFGSDSSKRGDLAAIAVRRTWEATGKMFTGTDVVIVGDTFDDINVSRESGARSVIVATGFYSPEELMQAAPDFLFTDFSRTQEVVRAILS